MTDLPDDPTARQDPREALRLRENAIELASNGIVITDPNREDNPVVYCNRAFEEITGYRAEEIIGKNCRILQRDDRNQPSVEMLRDAVAEGRELHTTVRNYRKDGTLFWNELTIAPIRNDRGEITHFVGVVNDVTARVAAEGQSRDRTTQLKAVLDTAVEAIITIDEQGICESLNPSAEMMFGYTAAEVIGRNVSMLMPPPFSEEHDGHIRRYLKTGEKKIIGIGRETVGRRKDGSDFSIHLSVSEVRLDGRRTFTGFIRDITQRKESERRLVQTERLAAVGEAMTGLAHESRNLLQRIQVAVELSRIEAEQNKELITQLDNIERASDRLQALLDEVRHYAAPIHLQLSESSLQEICGEAWQLLAPQRSPRQATLRGSATDNAAPCRVDRFRMVQVFRNLLENSLAACADPVEISLTVTDSHGGGQPVVQAILRDNGPGLNDEQRARIFEPFYTTKSKGTGLGMAIAQRIVEAHGGNIQVGQATRGGAEFLIELPR